MTALPPKAELDGTSGSHNQGVFKAAIGGVRDFLSGLFGADGTPATAFAAMKLLDPQAVYNLKPVFAVGSNTLTCTIKDSAGTDLAAGNPAFVGQRSATVGDGGFNLRAMTANVALTISSGSTLGHSSAVAGKIYWYLLDNAGAQVLAACGSFQGFSGLFSTTAEGGGGAADSGSVIYAVAAHSNLPGRLIAVTTDTQTTAGTWAALPSRVDLNPLPSDPNALPISGGTLTGPLVLPTAGAGLLPVGTQIDFMGSATPTGFLACDGSNVSRTTYAGLFAAVSTTWGVGDGSTTFTLPDSRRRVTVGKGGTGTGTLGNAIGNTGGAETHTLITSEMPSHAHGAVLTNVGGAQVAGGANYAQGSTGSAGGDGAHNNVQPSMVVTKAIKY